VRDLAVDRQFMFESLKRVKAWIPIDGTYDLGEGRACAGDAGKGVQAFDMYFLRQLPGSLSTSQWHHPGKFVGAAIVSQVRLFNMHPTGAMHAHERISALMEPAEFKIAPMRKIA